jgi:putative ABC transport system permease protein
VWRLPSALASSTGVAAMPRPPFAKGVRSTISASLVRSTALVSIARSSLRHETRRYLAAILSVTFAGLLMVGQMALLQGLFRSVSLVVDRSDADLWIVWPGSESADASRGVSRHADAAALIHPAVRRVEGLLYAGGDLRRADGMAFAVFLSLIDPSPSALAYSKLLSTSQRSLLAEPDSVLLDPADLQRLRGRIGDTVEINGRRAVLAGTVQGLRGVGGISLLSSFETGRRLDAAVRMEEPHNLLIALHPGADPERVARELADLRSYPRWDVRGSQEFSQSSQLYWMLETGMGIGAAFGVLLAFIVGVVVTSHTLAGAVLASIKELAALRALGVSSASLRWVVLELALWIGLVGSALTALLTGFVLWLARSQHIAMFVSSAAALATLAVIALITMVSALVALRPLFRVDPASLLR